MRKSVQGGTERHTSEDLKPAGHSVQLEPVVEIVSGAHGLHAVAVPPSEDVPAGQAAQEYPLR